MAPAALRGHFGVFVRRALVSLDTSIVAPSGGNADAKTTVGVTVPELLTSGTLAVARLRLLP